jgi:hypothetical protein
MVLLMIASECWLEDKTNGLLSSSVSQKVSGTRRWKRGTS